MRIAERLGKIGIAERLGKIGIAQLVARLGLQRGYARCRIAVRCDCCETRQDGDCRDCKMVIARLGKMGIAARLGKARCGLQRG